MVANGTFYRNSVIAKSHNANQWRSDVLACPGSPVRLWEPYPGYTVKC